MNKYTTNIFPFFTIFTPTYNRAGTLESVYSSLLSQTYKDFEWIIVDDGSKDNTEALVNKWIREGKINIRYFYQSNQGKHVAANRAINEALGELFLFFDSDDSCVDYTLEFLKKYWEMIPVEERENYSSINVLCSDENGRIIGGKYPQDDMDVISVWDQYKLRSVAERWGVNRTRILKEHLFPVFQGEKFITEAIVWNRISLHYKAKFVNAALRIYVPRSDGLMASSVRIRVENPRGARLFYYELYNMQIPFVQKIKALINFLRFSFNTVSFREMFLGAPSQVFYIFAFFPAYLMHLYDNTILSIQTAKSNKRPLQPPSSM